jgi:beta-glucosidase
MVTPAAAEAPWRDTRLSPDARAALMVREMSFDEKLGLVSGVTGAALQGRAGEKRIAAGHIPGVARLGLPDLYETDASLGVANANEQRRGDVAVALPSSLATAASFDPDIAFSGGAMIGGEARAKGFNVMLAGGANLTRDPWAGRDFEYLGEDAWLTGVMAGAHIRGVQSAGVVSTIKHFALNAQETGRTVVSADLAEAPLRESDLLAFQIAIERGKPGSVMCGYNRVNGDYDCENAFLLNDVLRRDWGYRGWVMSDWGAVHSTVKAANAGLDQQSGRELDAASYFAQPLREAVASGTVSPARFDEMARRIVREMIDKGLVDRPVSNKFPPIDYAADADVAQRAAEAGMVLLRNEGDLLPLTTSAAHILIVGGHADIGVLSGGGSTQVRPVAGVALTETLPKDNPFSGFIKRIWGASPPLAAIRARATGAHIAFVDGHDPRVAAEAAKRADVVILFAEQWRSEAMDLDSLALPDDQDTLIDAVSAANPKTVVVLETGGPVLMPWRDRVGAIVEAWYPGERGGPAITRLLFGDVNPSGRLPMTFPARAEQAPRPAPPMLAEARAALRELTIHPLPAGVHNDMSGGLAPFDISYVEGANVGYRWYQARGAVPLYPFGWGLSYTRFAYSALRIEGGDTPTVRFTVTNTGARAGADVPQLYAAVSVRGGPAIRRLVGFEKVDLAPGESRIVSLKIDPRLLAEYDVAVGGWRIRGGAIPLTIGRHAGDAMLHGTARIAPGRLPADYTP